MTFTPRGWKGPCYLIGEKHTFDWNEFWNETDWDYWESRRDDRCQNCAMHSGFEASVVRERAQESAATWCAGGLEPGGMMQSVRHRRHGIRRRASGARAARPRGRRALPGPRGQSA